MSNITTQQLFEAIILDQRTAQLAPLSRAAFDSRRVTLITKLRRELGQWQLVAPVDLERHYIASTYDAATQTATFKLAPKEDAKRIDPSVVVTLI